MDLSKYRHLFVSEAQEYLERLTGEILRLEPKESRRESVATVFRLFHSLKGMSGTMGYQPIFDAAHGLEELMDRVRSERLPVDDALLDALLLGVDRIAHWVSQVEADAPLEADTVAPTLADRVDALLARSLPLAQSPTPRPAAPPPAPASATPAPAPTPRAPRRCVLVCRSRPMTSDPAFRARLLVARLSELGRVVRQEPEDAALVEGRLNGPLRLELETALTDVEITELVGLMLDWSPPEIQAAERPASAPVVAAGGVSSTLAPQRTPVTDDDLLFSDDWLSTPAPGFSSAPEVLSTPEVVSAPEPDPELVPEPVPEPTHEPSPEPPPPAAVVRPARPARTQRVRTEWLDDVLDRVNDLMLLSQRLWTLEQAQPRPVMVDALGDLSRLLSVLHTEALTVRLSPLSVLTTRLPRVVRDLAREAGKQARLEVEGEEQTLDRALVEALDAPLTHLLRNAIEHGIEAPQERAARGKPPVGTITLRAERARDDVVLTLADDGAGVDLPRLVARAVDAGLLSPVRARQLASEAPLRLLCLPGLSAHAEAGAMGGRGVGMDAVHEAITALGGHLALHTRRGEGTRVSLRLPRTPGLARLLLVEVGGQTFGLPLTCVVHTQATPTADAPTEADGPAPLDSALGFGSPQAVADPRAPLKSAPFTIVVRAGGGEHAIAVERIVGHQDAMLKPLGPLLERIPGLTGVTISANGAPVFVLGPDRVAEALTGLAEVGHGAE